jgi:hypothetical protein
MTIAIAMSAPWRTKSTSSDIRGSNNVMASLKPVPAQDIPIAKAAPYRTWGLCDSDRRDRREKI